MTIGTQIRIEVFGTHRTGTIVRFIDAAHIEFTLAGYPGVYTARADDVAEWRL